jgi:hypothetical protein
LEEVLRIQWADNTKARIINEAFDNPYVDGNGAPPVRAQEAFREYVASLVEGSRR